MNSTTSALNITLSIERVFTEYFIDFTLFRLPLPADDEQRRALVEDRAVFLSVTLGNITEHQDTYVVVQLAERNAQRQQFTPLSNFRGLWLQETANALQDALNTGGSAYTHLYPLYDYQYNIPSAVYAQYLLDGDDSALTSYLALSPRQIANTGFVVRAGSTTPSLVLNRDPMVCEMTFVFQHWSFDVYQGQRG